MEWSSFLLMRHELVLTGAILLLLMAEIFIPARQKAKLIPIVIVLFGVHMIAGFLPLNEGSLFGGMFQTTAMHQFAKKHFEFGCVHRIVTICQLVGKHGFERGSHGGVLPVDRVYLVGYVFYDISRGFLNAFHRVRIGITSIGCFGRL